MPNFYRQLILQLIATLAVFSLAWPYFFLRTEDWNWPFISLAIGITGFLLARLSSQPIWWQPIHLLFAPLLWAGLQLHLDPAWFLATFILLSLIYRGTTRDQVPLYFSGRTTSRQLAGLLPFSARLVDVGAGIGSLLAPLSRSRPDLQLSGIENAPFPWLIGFLRCRRKSQWHFGDLWKHSLRPYNALYCFLSPTPMENLWIKATREMQPGSLFISKAFPIPNLTPETIVASGLDMTDTLYVYRI